MQAVARRNRLTYRWVPERGSGSHGTLYVGDRYTIVKDLKKVLAPGLRSDMHERLGIRNEDLDGSQPPVPPVFYPKGTAKAFASGFPIFPKRSREGPISTTRSCRLLTAWPKPLPDGSRAATEFRSLAS